MNKKSILTSFLILFFYSLFFSCSYVSLSISDFINNEIENYYKEIDKSSVSIDSIEENNTNTSLSNFSSINNYNFKFTILHNKSNINIENNFTSNKITIFPGDRIQLNNISIIEEDNQEKIITLIQDIKLSIYKESELILYSENKILEIPENLFHFSGNYSLVVTFRINEIVQEAIFIINL